ncbi:Translational_activator GCN1 [Hexamita inflata]|uniref:Translational_activator GCN1 n=1 Tax=Hexamita inflata TaxID=28002 RepID=A0ABP1H0Y5_9EUKA
MDLSVCKKLAANQGSQFDQILCQACQYLMSTMNDDNIQDQMPLFTKLFSKISSPGWFNRIKIQKSDELVQQAIKSGLNACVNLTHVKSEQLAKFILSDLQVLQSNPKKIQLLQIVQNNINSELVHTTIQGLMQKQPTLMLQTLSTLIKYPKGFSEATQVVISNIILHQLANEQFQQNTLSFKTECSSVYISRLVEVLLHKQEVKGINLTTGQISTVFRETVYCKSPIDEAQIKLIEAKNANQLTQNSMYLNYLKPAKLSDIEVTEEMVKTPAKALELQGAVVQYLLKNPADVQKFELLMNMIGNSSVSAEFLHLINNSVQAKMMLLQWILTNETKQTFNYFAGQDLLGLYNQIKIQISNEQLKEQLNLLSFNMLDQFNAKIVLLMKQIIQKTNSVPVVLQHLLEQIINSQTIAQIKSLSQTQVQIIMAAEGQLIDESEIPAIQVIPKNCDLKQEIKMKKDNQAREELVKKQLEKEQIYRNQMLDVIKKTMNYIDFMLQFVGTNGKLLNIIQVGLIDTLITIFSIVQKKEYMKQVFKQLNLLLSYVAGSRICVAMDSQPLVLVAMLKYMFNITEDTKLQELFDKYNMQYSEYPLYLKEHSIVGNYDQLLSQQLGVWQNISFAYPVHTLLPFLMRMQQIPQTLQKEFVFLSSSINCKQYACIDYKQLLKLLLSMQVQGFQHELAIEQVFKNSKYLKLDIDEQFVQPIMSALVDIDEEKRKLAALCLSFVPQNKVIIKSNINKLRLLLTEHLNDGTMRFFIACGQRTEYLQNNHKMIDELFDMCFSEENQILLEYVPSAIQSLCEENANKEFVLEMINILLLKHYSIQCNLEDTRFDTNNLASKHRACIWRIIEKMSPYLVSFDQKFDSDLPIGVLCQPVSAQVPQFAGVSLYEHKECISERFALNQLPCKEGKYEVIPAIAEKNAYLKNLQRRNVVYLEVDPKQITIIEAVFERFLNYGIFDFDKEVQQTAFIAVKQIITQLGHQFKSKINYALETGRTDLTKNIQISPQMHKLYQRAMQYSQNVKNYGLIMQYTVDPAQIKFIDLDCIGQLVRLQAIICNQYLWDSKVRGQLIDYLEELSQISDNRLDSNFNSALHNCWQDILDGLIIKQSTKQDYPHQNYSSIEQFAKEYLIPRYSDTVKFNADEFPGAVHCLTGVISKFGLSYLIQDVNSLIDVGCFCLRSDKIAQQVQGLLFVSDMLAHFKNLLEPYMPVFIQDILFLNSSEDQQIVDRASQIMVQILKSVSQFGISHITQIILDALNEENDWELIAGATDFVYNICCNSAKLPISQFKAMLVKLIPQFLPKLQINIYHPQRQVKESVLRTIEKVAELIQSPIIRAVSKKIIEAYIHPDHMRNVLIDLTELQFNTHIDAASVTLIYPICEKVLKKDSAIQFSTAFDRMKHLHIKTIAASVLSLLSEITNVTDFTPFIPQIKDILVENLKDTNEEIRKACAISIAKIVQKVPQTAKMLQNELLDLLIQCRNISFAHGLSMAIVHLSFQLNNWRELLTQVSEALYLKNGTHSQFVVEKCECGKLNQIVLDSEERIIHQCTCGAELTFQIDTTFKSADLISIALYLLYIPQKLLEINDIELITSFTSQYFKQCLSQVLALVRDAKTFKGHDKLITSIARQLTTSFLNHPVNCQVVASLLTQAIVDENYDVRELSISLIGDVISEIGATVMEKSSKQEREELKQIKQAINEIKVTGLAEEKAIKVFIPEKAINYAITQLSPEVYYKLALHLFLIRCDSTSNLRHQAVNMWKLVTIKPLTTMAGFLPFVREVLVGLLQRYYKNRDCEFNYKYLVSNTITELAINLNYQMFGQLCEQLHEEIKSATDYTLICYLDIFAGIAKNDKKNLYIKEELIYELPGLIKQADNEDLVNAAAGLLSSLQTDVTQLLDNVVQPQIAKIKTAQNQEELLKLAQGINVIIGTRFAIVNQLIKQCIDEPEISINQAQFVAAFYSISKLLQENTEAIVGYCSSRLLRDGLDVLEKSHSVCVQKQPIESIHPCFTIIKSMLATNPHAFDAVSGKAFETILNNVLEVQAPAAIMVAILINDEPVQSVDSPALLTSAIQSCFSNLHHKEFAGVTGFLMQAFTDCYQKIKTDDERTPQFLQLFISQTQQVLQSSVLARQANFPALQAIQNRCLEVFKILCEVQSPQTKVNSELSRISALNIMMIITLSTNHTFAIQQNATCKQIKYDDFIYSIGGQAENQKAAAIVGNGITGRAVMTLRLNLTDEHRIAFTKALTVLCQSVDISGFALNLRPEVEKFCLLHTNKLVQEQAIECLYQLFLISSKPEVNLHGLLNIQFKSAEYKVYEINEKIGQDLQIRIMNLLQRMLRASNIKSIKIQFYKATEFKFTSDNIYQEIIAILYAHVLLAEQEHAVVEAAALCMAECFLKLSPELFELELMKTVFMPSSSVSLGCAQLILMQKIFRVGLEQKYEPTFIQIQHAIENITLVNPQATNSNLQKFIEEKLVITSDSQLEEVGELIQTLSVLMAFLDTFPNPFLRIAQVNFVKAVEQMNKKFQFLSPYCKQSVLFALAMFDQLGKPFDNVKPGLKTQIGVFTLSYLQKCLMDGDTAQFGQQVLIDFYQLRYGSQSFDGVAKVLRQSNANLIQDMEYRVVQIGKLIKAGKV